MNRTLNQERYNKVMYLEWVKVNLFVARVHLAAAHKAYKRARADLADINRLSKDGSAHTLLGYITKTKRGPAMTACRKAKKHLTEACSNTEKALAMHKVARLANTK